MSCRGVERKVGSKLIAMAAVALMLMASGAAQAATMCDGGNVTLMHGASTPVTDSTTSPTLTGGSATATCNNGTLVYTSASCVPGCGATTVNWGAGCTASAAAILSGQSSNLTNPNPAYGGTVTSSCTNGVRASSSAVCNANCTIPAGQTWVVGANTCTNPTAVIIAHGTNGSRTDATQPTTGTGTWSCTNGTATLQGTSTCNAQCAAQAVNWAQAASNCTGTSAVLNHGASGTVSDGTAPATGNVNITCNNGVLAQSSPACTGTNSCAATTLNWTAGGRSCSDTVVAGIHGNTQALADTTANIAPGGTGTASAQCVNGAWNVTSPVCNASCGTQTVSWNPGCDASSGAILADDGSTRSITNTTAGYNGTRTIECNNGTVAQSGGSCVAAAVGCSSYTAGGVLYNPGPSTGGGFGSKVVFSTDGTRFAVAAPSESTYGSDQGHIFIFNTATNALLYSGFHSGNGASDDDFGNGTALDGNHLIAGDPERASNSNGGAHWFNITTGVGSRRYYQSTSGGTLERLGRSVSIDGSYAIVSGSEGRALVMNVPAWTVSRTWTVAGQNDAVTNDMDGTLGVLGIPVYANPGGTARIYNVSTGALVRTFTNPHGNDNGQFGGRVILNGGKLVVSAAGNDIAGTNKGAVYVFNASTGALLRTITDPNAAASDNYMFGRVMDFDGNLIIIGKQYDDVGGLANSGRVYIFDATTGALIRTINNPSPAAEAQFGASVAINGSNVAIAAGGPAGPGPKYGRVYRGTCN